MKSVTDFMANAKGLARNPLGIIALFISLIYGIAGLVLTISNKSLDINQNWVLIWFVVLFPVLILVTFVYLVVKHHQKLYGPSDFKDEHNFFRPMNTFELEQKLKEDIDLITDEKLETEEESINEIQQTTEIKLHDSEQPEIEKVEETSDLNKTNASALKKLEKTTINFMTTLENFYFLVEELVLKKLEDELRVPVSRHMTLDSNKETVQFDGVAFKDDEIIGIEVKYINNLTINPEIVKQIRERIDKVLNNNKMNTKFKFIIVFVSEKPIVNFSRIPSNIKSGFENKILIEVRYYNIKELKKNKL